MEASLKARYTALDKQMTQLNALNAYRKNGVRPPLADNPDGYYQAHGGFLEAPENMDMMELYRRKLEETRANIPYAVAAE